MRVNARNTALLVAMGLALNSFAVHLKVHGEVMERVSDNHLGKVVVRVYENGTLQYATTTNAAGKYEVSFANQGQYTVRFSSPGYASKSFSVDTRGPSWEGDNSKQRLYIGMTMVKRLAGFDLTLLEVPMGKARFDPGTGYVHWDKAWAETVEPQYHSLMEAYDLKAIELKERSNPQDLASFPSPRY